MYIDINTPLEEIEHFFNDIGFLNAETEHIEFIEKPGEGNMNVVLRVKTNKRSFIAKQSRPYVQKYQNIDAPVDRIDVEYQFYSAIESDAILKHIPKIIAYHKNYNLLFLEDLGQCEDMSLLYKNRNLTNTQINILVDIISNIHSSSVGKDYPENLALRELNYQHMFVFPFLEDNGFSLDDIQEGFTDLAKPYQTNKVLREKVLQIGEHYLSEGTILLHGDYYPGSWMQKDEHIFVIDPEFSFKGFAEFDLGVLAAHSIIITMDVSVLTQIRKQYPNALDKKLLSAITGVEIMRRLIGLAQLPLNHSLEEKGQLLEIGYCLIMSEND